MMGDSNDNMDCDDPAYYYEEVEEVVYDQETLEIEGRHSASSTSVRLSNKSKRKTVFTCAKCKRSYASTETYKTHLKGHLFEAFYREGTPDVNAFISHCREASKVILAHISEVEGDVGISAECTIAKFLLSNTDSANKFVDLVGNELLKCFPSPSSTLVTSFHSVYMKYVHTPFKVMKPRLIEVLQGMLPFQCSDTALQWLIGVIPMRLSMQAEVFVLRCVKELHQPVLQPAERDMEDDPKFCQSLYYVGGSAVKSVLRLGKKSSSPLWSKLVTCIKNKFLLDCSDTSAPSLDITAWTNAGDRGGLQHIRESVWVFLMGLTFILKDIEEDTGSIPHDKVIGKVRDDPIMILWDDIIKDSLVSAESDFLLTKFCYFLLIRGARGSSKEEKMKLQNVLETRYLSDLVYYQGSSVL